MKRTSLIIMLTLGMHIAMAQQKENNGAFIVRPYLQIGREPSASSLELVWHAADMNTDWAVEEKGSKNDKWRKTAAATYNRIAVTGVEPHRVYHVKLTGLSPGISFMYRVLANGRVLFSATGMASKSEKQDYRLVLFGDAGVNMPEQKQLAIEAYKAKPDLVFVPGDIVYNRGRVSEYRRNFWNIYNSEKLTEQGAPIMCSVPFVAAPGNHDIESRDLDQNPDGLAYFMFWRQPLNGPLGAEGSAWVPLLKGSEANKKDFLTAAGDSYPRMSNFSFNYGNAHWLIVDSNPYVDWTDKTLNEWVRKDLESDASQKATWRFVVFHHPGFNSSREHYEEQHMRLLSPLFEAGKVDIVFNGHVHNYQRTFPLTFKPDRQGTVIVGGKDMKTIRGRVVPGNWKLDKAYDGKTITKPKGIIYIVTGAGGADLYNVEQNDDSDSWQKFTSKFISNVHSLTIADIRGKKLSIKQISSEGKEIDSFIVTK